MTRRYSTRSRRASGSATAEPIVDGLISAGASRSGDGGYFEHSEFRARLEELRDACAVPGRIVLVTGPAGAGKSVVCEALLSELDPFRFSASISALQSDPYPAVLAAILGAYGFKVERGTSLQVMSELIAHHAGDPGDPTRQCVVAVDDADELPLRDLQALLQLVADSALTLVLAGPISLVPVLERAAQQYALDWQEVRLTGLSIGEVNAYLEWRHARESARGGHGGSMLFSEDQVKELTRRSRGLPGRLDQLVAKLQAVGASEGRALGPFGFPMRHLVLLASLALVLLTVFIIGQFADEADSADPVAQRVESLAMPPLPTPADVPGAAAAAGSPSEEPAGRPPATREIGLPVPSGPAEADKQPEAAPRPIISRQAGPAAAPAAPDRPATIAQPAPEPVAPPPVAPAPPPAPAAPAAPAPAAPAPAATAPVARATAPAAGGAPRTADWIMAQPAGSYTLQLVSLSTAERARSYIAQQPDPGSFATYRLMRNGQLFHVVVYGAFTSKAQADQAAARLPGSVGNIQPWVRQFGQVQESLRTTPQG